MKRMLRFAKLFIAFFLVAAGGYAAFVLNQEASVTNRDKPILISIVLVAVGLTILWTDWHRAA